MNYMDFNLWFNKNYWWDWFQRDSDVRKGKTLELLEIKPDLIDYLKRSLR